MIRAFIAAVKVIVLSLFLATILIALASLSAMAIVIYGMKMALWPNKQGVADILLKRLLR